jgi:hypothetical protein
MDMASATNPAIPVKRISPRETAADAPQDLLSI